MHNIERIVELVGSQPLLGNLQVHIPQIVHSVTLNHIAHVHDLLHRLLLVSNIAHLV